ncbi:MAG: glutamate--tRNA ligase [Candidatus Paceibacterota bacterium]|jgi:glutamyl-tRNA synthetase
MIQRLLKVFSSKKRVVTRFAPSPTGFLHAGNYRTAVFAYLYARQRKGSFILRIEDTDKVRSKKEYEDNIIESLKWLGLGYDAVYRQSERQGIHEEYLAKLIASDKAYVSKEVKSQKSQVEKVESSPKGRGEDEMIEVVRFRNPGKKVKFNDLIRGDIEFDTTELGDFVIARSVKEPLYHFAVVLDDYLMGVTHVIRGEDHISNTPRQILIAEALGAPIPTYAHLPLVLAGDKSKLSKRHGAKPITYYRDHGFLPDAVLNYMALIGWNPGTEQEIFSLDGLVESFDLSRVQKSGAVFNEEKLVWVNKEHLKLVPVEEFAAEVGKMLAASPRGRDRGWQIDPAKLLRMAPTVLDHINTYHDIHELILAGDFDYYFQTPAYDALSLKWKAEKSFTKTPEYLTETYRLLEAVKESDWTEEGIKAALWPYAEAEGRGSVLWPCRFALSGKEKSPNPFSLAYILGKEATLGRIKLALKKCNEVKEEPRDEKIV